MAKSAIDQQFEAHPLDFLETHTVQPQDFKDLGRTVAIYDHKTHTQQGGAAIDTVLSINARANQIAYTKLEPIIDIQSKEITDHNSYKLFFQQKAQLVGAPGDFIMCWFLPWASNHVTKLQIPPRIPPRPGALVSTATDPDIFFTAAINGCSVMVTGDPKSPVVAHGGTTDSRSNLSNENAFAGGNSRQHWTNLFQQNQQTAGNNGPILGIHKDDYINHALTGTTREAAEYTKYFEDNKANNLKVEAVRPKGAVFGLRDGAGNWSFYLQKSVTITFTRLRKKKSLLKGTSYVPATKTINKGGDAKDEVMLDQSTVTLPIQLVKFFPGGGGVPPNAYLPPETVKFVLNAYA